MDRSRPPDDGAHIATLESRVTRPDLDAIEARVNAATPGPWRRHGPETTTGWGLCIGPDGELVARLCGGRGSTKAQREADAAFLAGAPADIPAILAYVRELEATIAAMCAAPESP